MKDAGTENAAAPRLRRGEASCSAAAFFTVDCRRLTVCKADLWLFSRCSMALVQRGLPWMSSYAWKARASSKLAHGTRSGMALLVERWARRGNGAVDGRQNVRVFCALHDMPDVVGI